MNTIKDHVVSLEVMQKLGPMLKEAGVEVESNYKWYWYKESTNDEIIGALYHNSEDVVRCFTIPYDDGFTPTYLLSELLEVLPEIIEHGGVTYDLIVRPYNGSVEYMDIAKSNHNEDYFLRGCDVNCCGSLEDAAALLLTWCIENGYVGNLK